MVHRLALGRPRKLARGGVCCFLFLFFSYQIAQRRHRRVTRRLAAAVARMLQGLFPGEVFRSQLDLDDPFWLLAGSRDSRWRMLALLLLTVQALGLQLAWHKGPRGVETTWIGISFKSCGTTSSCAWR